MEYQKYLRDRLQVRSVKLKLQVVCYSDSSGMGGIMKKSILFRQIMALLIGTIVLYVALNMAYFVYIANNMFKKLQVQELEPRAEAIANLVLIYQKGIITKSQLDEWLLTSGYNDVVYIYDANGNLIIKNEGVMLPELKEKRKQQFASALSETFERYLNSVLSGEKVISSAGPILVVGQPVMNNGNVSGAVFLTRPPEELRTAIYGLGRSMMISIICVFLLMIYPVYRVTRRIVNPLKDMRDVAINMAHGNLRVRASETYKGEIGELGKSLNYLSARLSETISALTVERNRLKQIIDGLSEGIIAVDSSGNVTHVNPAIRDIFGTSKDEGRTGIIPAKDLWDDFDTVISRGYAIVRNMNWKQMVLRIAICPLEDESNNIAGAVGLIRDVTESERLEQTRREYVANVSHELRTPVSSLRAMLETLVDDMVPDENTKKRYYSHMMHETMRLIRLIDDLLTLSRLQSDLNSVKLEQFQIDEVIMEVADRYAVLAEEKGIKFSFSPMDEELIITSNADMVEQVIVILLDNAIKYTLPGGSISLDACFDDTNVWISVSDTGIGISPDDLPHIFERFYKSDKAHATQGAGLGLAIAYEITQRLGGKIEVDSKQGEGSVFTFTLPRNPGNIGKESSTT